MQQPSNHDRITLAIYRALDDVNTMPGVTPPLEHSPDTVIVGDTGRFDSLVFVAFVSALEEYVEQEFETSISILDLFMNGRENSCNVADLVSGIHEKLNGIVA